MRCLTLFFLTAFGAAGLLPADEGKWLLNRPPTAAIKSRSGFDLTREWLQKTQSATLEVGAGGSEAFVSADGLLLTRHHVAQEFVPKLSTKEKDLVESGFLARSPAQKLSRQHAQRGYPGGAGKSLHRTGAGEGAARGEAVGER